MDGVLIVDKPEGITSHDVVAAARRALDEPRIGHTGTLDPLATGVLPLAIGRATRLVRFLTASDKDYDATIRFGLATDTYDITGADVVQVIDWAQRQAGDSLTYAIALVYDDQAREQLNPEFGRGLVWLVGMDGNDQATEPEEEATQQRMLARRRSPVGVPPADHMPPDVPDPYNDGTQTR